MSIYSTVTAHNTQPHSPVTEVGDYDDPLVKLTALNEKGSTMAGVALPSEDSLAEYFSDDEEREKALKEKRDEKQSLQKNERE